MNLLVKGLQYSFFGTSLVLAMNTATQAATIDMSRFTCAQLLSGSPDAIEAAIWISGYYNGAHMNTTLDLENMKHNAEIIVEACKEDSQKTVMQTIDGMLAAAKKN